MYYDSMANEHSNKYKNSTRILTKWICDDTNDKRSSDKYKIKSDVRLNIDDWTSMFGDNDEGCPQQRNGYDCGVFVCMFALHAMYGSEMRFSQTDITNCRRLIAHEILTYTP